MNRNQIEARQCGYCAAHRGKPCRTRGGVVTAPHRERVQAARIAETQSMMTPAQLTEVQKILDKVAANRTPALALLHVEGQFEKLILEAVWGVLEWAKTTCADNDAVAAHIHPSVARLVERAAPIEWWRLKLGAEQTMLERARAHPVELI